MYIVFLKYFFFFFFLMIQLKESVSKNTDLQHQLEKAKQQHQELQALQQNTNGKLREAQVLRSVKQKKYKYIYTGYLVKMYSLCLL